MKRFLLLIILILCFPAGVRCEDVTRYDFFIARVHYDGGGDWYSDPTSLPNLLAALKERLSMFVPKKEAVVKLDDEELFRYPFLYMTGHGNISFSPVQVEALRKYFEQGGFLWADDNYGMDESFRREIGKVFPDSHLVELPFSHPIYHIHYKFDSGLPKIHEHDGKPPKGYGIFYKNRLVVFYTYETDIGDGLESPEVHDNPAHKREEAVRMAINIVLYSLHY
ncbi:MAG: DUF4159 domain-containing protein [Candidatus Auribacterota bacterium]|jgi:hypothetical protein|nr:DUF4159 domain-containing protein [Candidatus Auribacterota bacterium]